MKLKTVYFLHIDIDITFKYEEIVLLYTAN